jgi:hypothetical protein
VAVSFKVYGPIFLVPFSSRPGLPILLVIWPIFDAKGSADLALRKEKQAMDETFSWDFWLLQ